MFGAFVRCNFTNCIRKHENTIVQSPQFLLLWMKQSNCRFGTARYKLILQNKKAAKSLVASCFFWLTMLLSQHCRPFTCPVYGERLRIPTGTAVRDSIFRCQRTAARSLYGRLYKTDLYRILCKTGKMLVALRWFVRLLS